MKFDLPALWPEAKWPPGMKGLDWAGEKIRVVRFPDHDEIAPALVAEAMRRAGDDSLSKGYPQSLGIGSRKVYDLAGWGTAEATIIDGRAQALFGSIVQKTNIVTDLSWASVYSSGDWVAPHSHTRAAAAVLYVLDLGDDEDPLNGRFLFADPRMKVCTTKEEGCLTELKAPTLTPGTMMVFPAKAVHMVTPYRGTRPRITLSWNLGLKALAGDAFDEFKVEKPGAI